MAENSQTRRDEEHARRIKLAKEGPLVVERALKEMGVEHPSVSSAMSYDELKEEAMLERWRERGLL